MKKHILSAVCLVVMAVLLASCAVIQKTPASDETVQFPQKSYNNLTGKKVDDNFAMGQRPVAIMINNLESAYPQKGTDDADIIYEMVTEGGITRLMALYSDIENISLVGPVRSARDQFVQLMLPLNAIYVHIGTSTSAKRMLNFYSYQDIDGIYVGSKAFAFDSELAKTKASEHCWFTNKGLIRDGIQYENINTTGKFYPAFQFVDYDDEPFNLTTGDAVTVKFSYSGYADVGFAYNSESKKYEKYAFGNPHIDGLSGVQLAFDNVIIIKTDIGIQRENGVLPDFDFSSGEGWYFYGGKYQQILWEKGRPENPLILKDATTGEYLSVNVGKSYVGVISTERSKTLEIFPDAVEFIPNVKNNEDFVLEIPEEISSETAGETEVTTE